MLARIAEFAARRRWQVVIAWVLILIVAGAGAARVDSVLGPGSFVQKGSDSDRAATLLDRYFHQNDQRVTLVLVRDPRATVQDAGFRATVDAIAQKIRADRPLHVTYLDNPLVSGNRQLISRDGHGVALMASSSLSETKIEAQIDHLRALVRTPGITTYVLGTAAMNHDYQVQSTKDMAKGDSITVPILIVILLLVFGTLVAGLLPLVLAAFSIALSLGLVYILAHFMDTSVYVTNVVMVLGLGISIDYSLFILYRFREELRRNGEDVPGAVVRTMSTAGRAVMFSGLTVAIGLSSLILTNLPFMIAMGLGGMLVPLTSLVVTATLLPAVLALLGHRVNRFRVLPRRFFQPAKGGMWHRWATVIMRRPIVAGGAVMLILIALASPTSRLQFAFGSLKNSPQNVESVKGAMYMKSAFASAPEPIQVVLHRGGEPLNTGGSMTALRSLEDTIRHDPEVTGVVGPAEGPARYFADGGHTALISVTGQHEVGTKAAGDLVQRVRTLTKGYTAGSLAGSAIYVGGAQASFNDFNDALYAHFPLIIAIVLLLTYGFLFFAFRSIFLPLKAVLLNLLSVGAAYGMLVLVFQGGAGSSLLAFSPESGIASWVPVFLFAFLFGLSMDYEVFLLSRIREGWLQTGDNSGSVAFGLERTGRLITSAAAIMVIAFSGFLLGSELPLKEMGFGLLAAIVLDATLIRLVLVPSIMELMGRWNWWVPRRLEAFAGKGGLTEGDYEPSEEAMAA